MQEIKFKKRLSSVSFPLMHVLYARAGPIPRMNHIYIQPRLRARDNSNYARSWCSGIGLSNYNHRFLTYFLIFGGSDSCVCMRLKPPIPPPPRKYIIYSTHLTKRRRVYSPPDACPAYYPFYTTAPQLLEFLQNSFLSERISF